MSTFVVIWNPSKWPWDPSEYAADVTASEQGKPVDGEWAVGNRRSGLGPGDRVFLLRQESERGLIASGTFTTPVFQGAHWDGSNRQANFAEVSWDVVLHTEDRLPIEVLKSMVGPFTWDRIQAGGIVVAPPVDATLETVWADHLAGVTYHSPEEVPGAGRYPEGTVSRVEVNRYERDRAARQACIAQWGTACVVCGVDFEAVYGGLGRGFIHVHHLRELSTVGPGYTVDPVADLRPVCPNCHAMLHQQRPALTPTALKRRLARKASSRRRSSRPGR